MVFIKDDMQLGGRGFPANPLADNRIRCTLKDMYARYKSAPCCQEGDGQDGAEKDPCLHIGD
jgi:hypothetical protein